MTDANQLKEKLEALGVSHAAVIPVSNIPFDRRLRESCEANRCGAYGTNWACPPLCGEIDELIAQAKTYQTAVVFQNIYQIDDSFDIEGMERAARGHQEMLRRIHDDNTVMPQEGLLLGAGGCTYCERCAAADHEPCRFPGKAFASLEAYGIFVSELAEAAGLKYINGVNTITYFGAILLKK